MNWFMVFCADDQIPLHPETRHELFDLHVAYSLAVVENICAVTGIDWVEGMLCTLDAARAMRRNEQITGFVVTAQEDTEVLQ